LSLIYYIAIYAPLFGFLGWAIWLTWEANK
jgi:hypothetical protein